MTRAKDLNMYAITVRPDNTAAEVELADGNSQATLDSLYSEIGCRNVEALKLAPDLIVWFDDEAGELPLNRAACAVNGVFGHGSAIVGTVVYTGGADAQGNVKALSNDRSRDLRARLESMAVTW